jgi:hypothetical protein
MWTRGFIVVFDLLPGLKDVQITRKTDNIGAWGKEESTTVRTTTSKFAEIQSEKAVEEEEAGTDGFGRERVPRV